MDIKFDVVGTKQGKGPWVPCSESDHREMSSSASCAEPTASGTNCSTTSNELELDDDEVDDDDDGQETGDICDRTESHTEQQSTDVRMESHSQSPIQAPDLADSCETNVRSICSSSGHQIQSASDMLSDGIVDPAHFSNCRITASVIMSLMNENHIPNEALAFPVRNGRVCSRSWFFADMPDGDKRVRKWLSYSKSTDSLFCIDCLLFAGPSSSDTWTRKGYTDWSHATRDIPAHESSAEHHAAEVARFMWSGSNPITDHMLREQQSMINRNRRVVYVSIKCLRYLSSEMEAIRGHDTYDGKFLHLFREFAEFEASAASYLEMLDGIRSHEYRSKPEVNLLSPLNCRRLLITMRDMIVKKVVADINSTRVCSLISDGTQDQSKMEAQCVLLRYLESSSCGLRPVERLVDIFTTGDTAGVVLSRRIEQTLSRVHVPLEWLVGQSYDGAGNVRGKYSGLKKHILEIAPRAVYVWCNAHRLNLVIEAVLKCSSDICNALGTVQELYNFFLGHKRHSILLQMQQDESENTRVKALKRVSDTTRSWRSAEDGTATVLDCYDSIAAALQTLAADSADPRTTASANGLLVKVQDSRFILTTIFLQHIFRITGPVSRMLQSKSADLSVAATLVDNCIKKLTKKRDNVDHFFTKLRQEAADFCTNHGIKSQLKDRRSRMKKRMADEQCDDECIQDTEQAFKVEVVVRGIDVTLEQLKDRFSNEDVAFLREIQLFSPAALVSSKSISATDVENICKVYGLDADLIARERNSFAPVYRSMSSLVNVSDLSLAASRQKNRSKDKDLNERQQNDSGDDSEDEAESGASSMRWLEHSFVKPLRALEQLSSFPNLLCLMKILVTLAVTSCSAERVMSRVRIIKNRLRSTMDDEWFSSLTILASESDIMGSLQVNDIIDSFALCSPKLQNILGVHAVPCDKQ